MSFNEIIGQKEAKKILRDELKTQRINHAYLFIGKDGLGKRKLALEFVRALFCEKKELDSCGQCVSCKKIKHQNHADVRLSTLKEGSSKFSIGQVREIQQEIIYKPYESSRKVFIIDDADKMSLEAANSLLRTLEEPPEYAVFILLAEDINQLLPTIISRCQQIFFYNVSGDRIEQFLKEKGASDDEARLFSRLSGGSPWLALETLQDEQFLENRSLILDLLSEIKTAKRYQVLQKTEKISNLLGEGFPVFDLISTWYRDIILCIEGNYQQIVNVDYLKKLKKECQQYNTDCLITIMERINKLEDYIDKNVNKRLTLEVLFLGIRAGRM